MAGSIRNVCSSHAQQQINKSTLYYYTQTYTCTCIYQSCREKLMCLFTNELLMWLDYVPDLVSFMTTVQDSIVVYPQT